MNKQFSEAYDKILFESVRSKFTGIFAESEYKFEIPNNNVFLICVMVRWYYPPGRGSVYAYNSSNDRRYIFRIKFNVFKDSKDEVYKTLISKINEYKNNKGG